jgi:hypothetical protein
MSRIRKIRESVDARLDKLDAHADAFEATLHRTKEGIDERIERGKQEVHRALDTLRADVDKSKQFSEAQKQKIRAEIDNLKVQIALGKADARDALAAARKRLHEGARKVDAAFDKRRQGMSQEIAEFKRRLGEKKAHTAEKLTRFEEEMRGGFEQVAKAFKDLFA